MNGATWVVGKINSALSFNGLRATSVTPSISLGSTFSISAWVNPSTTQQGGYVRILETQYNGGFYLGTDVTGTKYKFIVNTAIGSDRATAAQPTVAPKAERSPAGWHLVTATYDGAAAKLYVDGVVIATDTFTAPGAKPTSLSTSAATMAAASGGRAARMKCGCTTAP